ncbi:armadillo-type fold protein [Tanacetum coccineum]
MGLIFLGHYFLLWLKYVLHSSPTKPNATPSNTTGSTTAVSLQAVNGPYMWNPQWCSAVKHICQGTSPLVVSSVKWLEDELHLNALHNPGSRRESRNEKVTASQRSVLSAALGGPLSLDELPKRVVVLGGGYIAKSMFPKGTSTEPVKTDDGIKVTTDHGEELMADVVLFATGKCTKICSGFDPTVDVEPLLLKLFRNLWFYVALFGLAPPVLLCH